MNKSTSIAQIPLPKKNLTFQNDKLCHATADRPLKINKISQRCLVAIYIEILMKATATFYLVCVMNCINSPNGTFWRKTP